MPAKTYNTSSENAFTISKHLEYQGSKFFMILAFIVSYNLEDDLFRATNSP